jgi:hypothetical protein
MVALVLFGRHCICICPPSGIIYCRLPLFVAFSRKIIKGEVMSCKNIFQDENSNTAVATCKNLTTCNGLVASLSTSCNNAVISLSCYKVVTQNLLTRCVRNRLVASLSTSCNDAVILSSCYKVVTQNLLTRLYKVVTQKCVRNRLVASLSTSCNNAVILSSCYKVVTHNLSTRCKL